MAKASDNPYPSLLLVEQSAAPSTPASGQARLYRGTDNKLYVVDDAGTVVEVGGTGGSGGTPAMVLLKETTLAATAASVTFGSSDIPATTYRNLRVEIMARSSAAANTETMLVDVNGDTTAANYYSQRLVSGGAVAPSSAGSAASQLGVMTGGNGGANQAGLMTVNIPEYRSTTWQKFLRARSYDANTPGMHLVDLLWKNTAAITALAFRLSSGNSFAVGSKFLLYGERDVTP